MNTIYLDNNATTAIAPEVMEEMLPCLRGFYGNPSSAHSMGRRCFFMMDKAREKVASLIGAEPEEIVFTSGGTEGRLDWEAFTDALDDHTALVSVMYANNETGVVFPIAEIGAACRERGIPFHTDAVQAVGKVPIDVKKLRIDMLSMSGHKLHAPKGIGALYLRKGLAFSPSQIGGHQESGRRAGTENLASIVALGKACELASGSIAREAIDIGGLRDLLELSLRQSCDGVYINGGRAERLFNTANISISRVDGTALLNRLDRLGICASAGSACASGSSEPSHVLRAMGVPGSMIGGTIRFSLSRYTTREEIDATASVLHELIEELRARP